MVSETFVSVEGLLDFVFLWLKVADVWQDLKRTDLIFNFARPFFHHYPGPFWYRYGPLFLYYYALAELVSNIKFSIRGSQGTAV